MEKEIFSVLYKDKIRVEFNQFKNRKEIEFFCICVIENYNNKRIYFSNMPEWATEYYKLSINKYDAIFDLQNYVLNDYLIPIKSEYDAIQKHIIEEEEKFGHFDAYSIARKSDNISFIALALTSKYISQQDKIRLYKETLHNFENFVVNIITSLKKHIFVRYEFINKYENYFNEEMLFKIINSSWKKDVYLTDIEHKIIQFLKFKKNVKDIAYSMSMNINTCRSHISNVRNKLGVVNNEDLNKLCYLY